MKVGDKLRVKRECLDVDVGDICVINEIDSDGYFCTTPRGGRIYFYSFSEGERFEHITESEHQKTNVMGEDLGTVKTYEPAPQPLDEVPFPMPAGISRRDLFAAMAMMGMMASQEKLDGTEIVALAPRYADRLAQELDKAAT